MVNKIAELIAPHIEGLSAEDIISLIEIPPRPDMGDFAFPCFRLAKTMRKAPQLIANELASSIENTDFIDEIKTEGAYVNFYVNKEIYVKSIIDSAL